MCETKIAVNNAAEFILHTLFPYVLQFSRKQTKTNECIFEFVYLKISIGLPKSIAGKKRKQKESFN